MPDEREKLHKLEDINRRLYSRDESLLKKRKEKPLSKFSYDVPTEWATGSKASVSQRRKGWSFFKKFFVFSIVIFLGAVSFALYKFGTGSNTFSANNLEIEISVNPFVESAKETDVSVNISNKNSIGIEISSLVLEYQKGESIEGENGSVLTERKKIDIGNADSFSEVSGNTRVILFGDQGSRRSIKATLEYRVSGSSAIFLKSAEREVLISSAPITVTVEAPKNINPGQEIDLNLKISSNSETVARNMLIKAIYPFGFQFKESNPKTFSGDSVWFLGDLAPGASKNISIKGLALGDPGEQRIFRVLAGEQDKNNQSEIGVLYSTALETLNLSQPSLDLKVLISGKDQEFTPTPSGNRVRVDINWSNNTPNRIEDLEISARLTGNALNKNSVSTETGLYNHLEDIILWNKSSLPAISSVNPGDRGTVSFSFIPLSTIEGTLISSPAISIEASIKGRKINDNNTIEPVSNFDRIKTVRVASNLQVSAKALYYSGPIQNTGPIPPKAGSETTYTIVWTVTNSNNDVDRAEVRAKLAPFAVRWIGRFEPQGEDVIFNETTKEIIWRLGRVSKGVGIGSSPREVSFQIGLQPFLSQVNTTPTLIEDTVLTGEDGFAGASLRNTKNPITTRINLDSGFKSGDEVVVQ